MRFKIPRALIALTVCLAMSLSAMANSQGDPFNRKPTVGITWEHTLLVIDVSDPSAVRFTATDLGSLITAGNGNATTLEDFFASPPTVSEADLPGLVGDLTAAAQGSLLDAFRLPPGDRSFLFTRDGGFNSGDYIEDQRAFTGSSTLDLSLTSLPAPGTAGSINVNSLGDGSRIGSYLVVVPEPSGFLGVGLVAGIASVRRPRRTPRDRRKNQ